MHLYPNNPKMSMNPLNNSNMLSKPNSEEVQYVCDVPNIAIQRWVQVGVVLQNRTLDVYINGKLARSGILQGIPKMNNCLIMTRECITFLYSPMCSVDYPRVS